uniref:Green fluorescent protein n=1 Tax=Ptilosarcus sp. CSG-2001 TaxID=148587 RepID=Q9BLZ0_9CNID|nr:green fluorescent protein [Ptilosarcus sp. CSG-2001]
MNRNVLKNTGLKEIMSAKASVEGIVNNHVFSMEGFGKGNVLFGNQLMQIRVTKGGPLPFAFDIVSIAFQYGNRTFTKYPDDIADYFVQSFPAGFFYERNLRFEDGAIVDIRSDISLEDDKFHYKVEYRGNGFPSNGPVMQKAILGMEPSFEVVYMNSGVLVGEVDLVYKLESGNYYSCHMKTFYRSKGGVKEFPEYHFIHHRLEKTYVEEGSFVEQHETAIAQLTTIGKPLGSLHEWV